jgi:pilus assembly protein FimV
VHKSKLRRITLAVCFALMPVAANAAGLGKLTVISGLGEPLNAEIELLSTTPEELSTLTAAIAPEEAYAVQGLERSPLHNAIQVEVSKKPNGTPILKLSTRQPVSDPFLDMLVQVDWASGRLLREYTVLLDPPGYSNNAAAGSAAVRAPTVQSTSPSGSATSTESGAASGSTGNQQPADGVYGADAPTAEKPVAPTEQEYITAKGDTLSSIARRMSVEGVSLEQMLTGLYNANEDAFVGGNMNRLKTGQILRIPSAEELQSTSQGEAVQQVRVHSNDWNAYRNRLASLVETAPAAEDADTQSSGGKITAATEDKAAPAARPRDVVRLSKSDATTGDGKALQDRINALQEEVIAKEKAAQEANERTAMLEKQIADMQKLLAIKNQSLAEMQKNAAGAAAATATPEQPAANTPEVVPSATTAETPEAAPAQTAAAPESSAVEPTAPAAKPAETTPEPAAKTKKKITPPPPPIVEEPGILDGLAEDPMLLAAAGGGLVLLGGGWVFLRNRRRRNLDSFEQGILTAGGLKANTVFGNTAGGTVDTGDTSFLTDFSQSGGGMIDTHDVDPIAEAEVYMAYGRDAQAEEILKDAIAKEPQRYELHLKLLEIIANRKDTAAFETIAGELYSTLGSNDPTWFKVAEMGQQLEPGNPLYDTKGASPAAVAVAAAGTGAVAAAEKSRLDASDFENAEELSESSLDFSLGGNTNNSQASTATEDTPASGLDFDLGGADAALSPGAEKKPLSEMTTMSDSIFGTTEMPEAEAPQAPSAMDFDLGQAEAETVGAPQTAAADFGNTVPGLDMPSFSQPEQTQELKPETGLESPPAMAAEDMGLTFEMPELGAESQPAETPSQEPAEELPRFDQTVFMEEPSTADTENEIRFESAADEAPSFELPDLSGVSVEEEKVPGPGSEGMGLDFNFETEIGASDTPASFETQDEEAPNPPEIDLSGITLDFGPTIDNPEVNNESTFSATAEEVANSAGESPDVETKLDLVSAYMEMGDKEGARELLDEVLKEGGPQQKARAQEMLGSLG